MSDYWHAFHHPQIFPDSGTTPLPNPNASTNMEGTSSLPEDHTVNADGK
jgi:hypothetical protein